MMRGRRRERQVRYHLTVRQKTEPPPICWTDLRRQLPPGVRRVGIRPSEEAPARTSRPTFVTRSTWGVAVADPAAGWRQHDAGCPPCRQFSRRASRRCRTFEASRPAAFLALPALHRTDAPAGYAAISTVGRPLEIEPPGAAASAAAHRRQDSARPRRAREPLRIDSRGGAPSMNRGASSPMPVDFAHAHLQDAVAPNTSGRKAVEQLVLMTRRPACATR